MFDVFQKQMEEGFQSIGVSATEKQIKQFYQYFEMLVEWNKVMNLTAITEQEDVVTKHFVDSISIVKAGVSLKDEKVIDIGTGAGFPGIPLKIMYPSLKITLLDSLNKRIKFLNEVCSCLGLENVETLHGRAEDFGRDSNYREKYDYCVSRAVANLSTLSEYCMPFVKVGGYFIPYKSGKLEEEMVQAKGAVKLLGGKIEEVVDFTLPGTDAERSFVKIVKREPIAKRYPRKAGMPSKEPLK